jgi:3-deoxy-manno-octulosonate cytidylyltransferase (CMP-KDO synthetase)
MAEGLEQLRALEYGFRIRVVEVCMRLHSVDTPEDLSRVQKALERSTISGEVRCAQ